MCTTPTTCSNLSAQRAPWWYQVRCSGSSSTATSAMVPLRPAPPSSAAAAAAAASAGAAAASFSFLLILLLFFFSGTRPSSLSTHSVMSPTGRIDPFSAAYLPA